VGGRGTTPCEDVSFSVPVGCTYALLGATGAGKGTIVACIRGDLRPAQGRVVVFGLDARRERRALRKRILFARRDDQLPPRAATRELLVLEEKLESLPGATVFLTTADPALAARADRVAILRTGRLLVEDDVAALLSRFRRISYVNEVTETRAEYGNELDLFDAVRVRVRGWGVEAVVSNFDDAAFESFRGTDGVKDARAEPMTLAEIFAAVAGP
jgi:ABC-type multidrug transport system ATPase subunit